MAANDGTSAPVAPKIPDGGGDRITDLIPLDDEPFVHEPRILARTDNTARQVFSTLGIVDSPTPAIDNKKFFGPKEVTLKAGPCKGAILQVHLIDADGLIYFPAETPDGRIMQAVYRIELEAQERTDEDKKFGRPTRYEWIGNFVGLRYQLKPSVNGIRKGSDGR